jgi:threonylcarbamoyladenosine tRNA methylthiotransferase MtaB
MPTFRIVTLGCKLNQADSTALEAALRRLGLTRAGTDADLFVLNTCTVTGAADREARQIARRLRRARPETHLIVTGCYAERDAAALAGIAGATQFVGMRDQAARVAALAARAFGLEAPALAPVPADGGTPAGLSAPLDLGRFGATDACDPGRGDHTRAFLKIQDGCDLRCSYCVIPSVRGASRSLPVEEILARLRRLAAGGLREIVFTGVNSGDWGRDLTPATRLHELLPPALDAAAPARLRLNSLEPRTVTPEIAALLASAHGRLARHLQIPLQSGCDAVLARMRRNYRTADYARVVDRLAAVVPEAALGADVIVGFPGETDAEFETTCRFVEASPLAYLHVFSYSARPGTPAATMPGQVAPAVVRERSARLRATATALSLRFRRRFVGRTVEAIVLHGSRADGRIRALTDNYIDVWLEPGGRAGLAAGVLTPARVTAVDAGDTLAEIG